MPFTTSAVGSLPRPKELIDAAKKRQPDEISQQSYSSIVEMAVADSIKREEEAGLDVITDGEQRRGSFVGFIGGKISGFRQMNISQLNPDAKEILRRNRAKLTHSRAVVVSPIRNAVLGLDEFEAARRYSRKPFKVALPAPYLAMWECWDRRLSEDAYPEPEDFAYSYAKLVRNEIVRLKQAGVSFVQLDEPMMGDLIEADSKPDRYHRALEELSGQRYRGIEEEARLAADLVNKAVWGISGVRIGVHIDRWPNADTPYHGTGYEKLLPDLLEMHTNQLVLEYAAEGSGDPARLLGELPPDTEIGFGCIDVQSTDAETPEEVVKRVRRITSLREPEKIWLNPDCGFAPCMTRAFPREAAFAKLRSMVKAAEMLRKDSS